MGGHIKASKRGQDLRMHRMFLLAPLLAAALLSNAASAQSPVEPMTFRGLAECATSGRIPGQQCGVAFRNARAEYEEKAPRYRSGPDCRRRHGACVAQLAGSAGGQGLNRAAQVYVPTFRGMRIASGKDGAVVLPLVEKQGGARFEPRAAFAPDERVEGRVAVIPDSSARRAAGPYVRRGDRDDTIRMNLRRVNPNETGEAGLFVDSDGVEWYRPARRR